MTLKRSKRTLALDALESDDLVAALGQTLLAVTLGVLGGGWRAAQALAAAHMQGIWEVARTYLRGKSFSFSTKSGSCRGYRSLALGFSKPGQTSDSFREFLHGDAARGTF